MNGYTKLTIFGVTLAFASSVQAETFTREDVSRLQQDCQRSRQEQIQPLKQQEMERCVSERGHDRQWCEKDLEYFGEASGGRPGMFWDLPACQLAFDVERYFKRYPGKQSYSP